MLTVSRRGLLALGGTGVAGVALAACGQKADQRDDASQDALLESELEAEVALAGAYRQAAATSRAKSERATLEAFAAASARRADDVRGLISQPSAGSETPEPDGGPDAPEALTAAANLAGAAIVAHRDAAGLLDSTETRTQASASLVACAAELAAVNHFAGRPEAPNAFVTGGDQTPHEAVDTSSTSTSTTSTAAESTSTTTGAP